jgi:potassium-dependent mechanosensitive channel
MTRVLGAIGLMLALLGGPAWAQTTDDRGTIQLPQAVQDLLTAQGGTAAPQTGPDAATVTGGLDYTAWQRTAERTEAMSELGRGSTFALERLRSDLVGWRDKFLVAQAENATRIATVRTQIAALGLKVDTGVGESDLVAARRAALEDQLARLRAPVVLATEAYAHANGLIGEIDGLIREGQANQLLTRGTSPLNPTNWPEAARTVTERAVGLFAEARASLRSEGRRESFVQALPKVIGFLLVAGALLVRGRVWMDIAQRSLVIRTSRGRGLWTVAMSLGQIIVPMLGIYALTAALAASGLLGFRTRSLVDALPYAWFSVVFTTWLAGHFFGPGAMQQPPLDFAPERRQKARHSFVQLGWLLAIGTMLHGYLAAGEVSAAVSAIVTLPVEGLLALHLFRIGTTFLNRAPVADVAEGGVDPLGFRRPALHWVGRISVGVALLSVLLALLGYAAAAQALIYPFVMTLGLIGLVILAQGLVFDIYTLIMRTDEGARDALIPVLLGFCLILLALPVAALIWGARQQDLNELWARFREGFAVGETQISPTDFVTFVVVFGLGYAITRLVQSTLKTSVLPKTRIDPGGQNAVVSGIGYIGVFLAAVMAITTAGIDLSSLAIVAGALSVGIGFGLQNIVSNFVAGIILLIERPISEGDWIEVGGKMGYVRDISVRSTRIETFDRTNVIIPNADLVAGQVTNWTRGNAVGRVTLPVAVMFGPDVDRIMGILREIAEGHPMVLLVPPPVVVLMGFGADAMNFEIRAVVRDINFGLNVRSEMNAAIARRFYEEGVELAGGARGNASAGRTAKSEPAAEAAPVVQIICTGVEKVGPVEAEVVEPAEPVPPAPDQDAVDDAELGEGEIRA